MVMVKPGMPYSTSCGGSKTTFAMPTFVYQVSGNYAMIAAPAPTAGSTASGRDEACWASSAHGADGILTYFAPAGGGELRWRVIGPVAANAGRLRTRSSFRARRRREPGISRFRVWSFGPSRNDGGRDALAATLK